MSQLFPFVMSSVEEIYLLNASALLSVNAAIGHSEIYHQSDSSPPLKRARISKTYLAVHRHVFLQCAGFSAGCLLSANWTCEPCEEGDLHYFYNSCLTDKSRLLSAAVRGGGPWMFLEFLHLFAYWCALTCSYRFLSKLYYINYIMLFRKVSLSLCYFVQLFLSLLSTITVCNMNLVKRNMQYFKHLPLTVFESQAHTQNLSEASIYNLK